MRLQTLRSVILDCGGPTPPEEISMRITRRESVVVSW